MNLDTEIQYLEARIRSFQRRLDALLEVKCAGIEAANLALAESMPRRKPSPLKGRIILENYECAVSTAIKRLGGIRIPADLKEEFGGWGRLHCAKALPVDEMAEALAELGLIEEATTNALLDGLKSGRKSARFSERSVDAYYAEEGMKLANEQNRDGCPF